MSSVFLNIGRGAFAIRMKGNLVLGLSLWVLSVHIHDGHVESAGLFFFSGKVEEEVREEQRGEIGLYS